VLPTGGGKTVVFCKVIEALAERGERVLIIVHRTEILDQTMAHPGRLVQLASIQTLARRVADGRLEYPKADVTIVDECHHAMAWTWRAALDANPNARRCGFTATPCRGDGRGLGGLFDELIVGPQVAELQSAGHLTPVKYFAPAKPDLRGVTVRNGDYAVHLSPATEVSGEVGSWVRSRDIAYAMRMQGTRTA
jgi:DNA repair protein RadD